MRHYLPGLGRFISRVHLHEAVAMGRTTYQELREVWGINIGPPGTPEAFARNGVPEHPHVYAENNPLSRADPSGDISVPCYGEKGRHYCGRASQEMVIDFWKPSFHTKYDQTKRLSCPYIKQYTGKAYALERGATDSTIDSIIRSLDTGNPVIAYTNAYPIGHIFVLVGYDHKRCLFSANNPLPKDKCQAGVTKVGGTELTRQGLLDLLKGGKSIYGHTACYVK